MCLQTILITYHYHLFKHFECKNECLSLHPYVLNVTTPTLSVHLLAAKLLIKGISQHTSPSECQQDLCIPSIVFITPYYPSWIVNGLKMKAFFKCFLIWCQCTSTLLFTLWIAEQLVFGFIFTVYLSVPWYSFFFFKTCFIYWKGK